MPEKISESRFFMWRALFAVAHADEVVTSEERNFMNKALAEQPLSDTQIGVLKCDIEQKQDIKFLFDKITDQHDRSEFFDHARTLVWCDGDFGDSEREIMALLGKAHMKAADLDTLEDVNGMALEEGAKIVSLKSADIPKQGMVLRILRTLGGV